MICKQHLVISGKLIVLFSLLTLPGCRPGETQDLRCADEKGGKGYYTLGETDPVASAAAKPCGAITLWGGSFPKSLNMWLDYNSFSTQVMGLLFEPLATLHSVENRVVGHLAESWEVSADSLDFLFRIRPEAKWSDGSPILARDVQFYYDVIMNPSHLTAVFKVGLSRFERPEVVDERTLRIRAKARHWANFYEVMGLVAFPYHVWKGKDFNTIRFEFPVVSGPYKVRNLRMDRHLELERRSDWWGRALAWNRGKYNFVQIRWRFMVDRDKALEALKRGDFDAYPIYTASIWVNKTQFEAVQKGWVARQRIFNQEPIGFQGMAINLRREKFQDIRVRRALALLLDRELMNEKYMHDQYFLLNAYFPDLFPNNQNPAAPLYLYRPDSARALLAQAGYVPNAQGMLSKDGQALSITFITQSEDLRHLTLYQEALQRAGIDVKIEQMSWSSLRKRIDEFDFDMYWAAWGAGRLRDPEASWHSSTAMNQGTNNIAGVMDPVVDSLVELQKNETDLDRRAKILRDLDTRLAEIIPYVLLWQSDSHRILYWNRFGMPTHVFDKFNREDSMLPYWWVEPTLDSALRKARSSGSELPRPPAEVRWQEL